MNGPIWRATPFQVRVLSQGEKRILLPKMITLYHAKYFAHELTKRCASDG